MFRFSIRDALWAMIVVGLSTVVVRDRWENMNAPLILDGYCPVTLVQTRRWKKGEPNCQAIYGGGKYKFVSDAEKKQFESSPIRFAPACDGNDPVRLKDEKRVSPGFRSFGLTYNLRIYLFDSEESLQKFSSNPIEYAQP